VNNPQVFYYWKVLSLNVKKIDKIPTDFVHLFLLILFFYYDLFENMNLNTQWHVFYSYPSFVNQNLFCVMFAHTHTHTHTHHDINA